MLSNSTVGIVSGLTQSLIPEMVIATEVPTCHPGSQIRATQLQSRGGKSKHKWGHAMVFGDVPSQRLAAL